MKFKELVQELEKDGWYLVSNKKHRKYRHPLKPGQLTIPFHTGEVPSGTASRILKDAGLR
jgi:predicted RNA binding protein YcfA (HicA-like mRNA interferase family)